MREYAYDYIDGKHVPPLVITQDTTINGTHNGSVHLENGCLTITGTLNGSLNVQSNTKAIIFGTQNGSVSIDDNALIVVNGSLNGSTHISKYATVVVEKDGKLAGSLSNNGKLIIRGVFGGSKSGHGEVILEGNGYIKQPTIKNDASSYEW